MERDQATKFINDLLKLMVGRNGSDLFITGDFPPAIKVDGKVTKVSPQPLNAVHTLSLARSIMNDKQAAEFERTKECNFAISPAGIGRFRVSAGVRTVAVGSNSTTSRVCSKCRAIQMRRPLTKTNRSSSRFLAPRRDSSRHSAR